MRRWAFDVDFDATTPRRQPSVTSQADTAARRFASRTDSPISTALLEQLQRTVGNRAARRMLPMQRCGAIPHEKCPCNDGATGSDTDASPQIHLQRQPDGPGDQTSEDSSGQSWGKGPSFGPSTPVAEADWSFADCR